MYAIPIKKNGNVVGLLIGRKDGNALNNLTDKMGYGKNTNLCLTHKIQISLLPVI
jgi:hypothetical protein